jgi:hypothetical protein
MSLLRKAKEVTSDLAAASKRQAQRGKLELEVKRVESRISSEKDAIGHTVFPLLRGGSLAVDVPEVALRLKNVEGLEAETSKKREELETLRKEGESADETKASMQDTDHNASERALADQSAKDAVAIQGDNPAEQGGQG